MQGMAIDAQKLDKTLAALRGSELDSAGVGVALQQVIDAAHSLFGVSGTGLMFIDEGQALHYVAASDDGSRVLEEMQEEHGVGPCVDALVNDVVVQTNDIAQEPRYAAIAPTVTAHGVRAVLGVPVRIGGSAVGSLDAYSDEPHAWDESEVDALTAFATLIETIVSNALLSQRQNNVIEQLEFALQNRVTIERAVGVVMARDGTGPVEAFNTLRTSARSQRRKVTDVAAEVLYDVAASAASRDA
jgi:GAF domain-containing protein